jgi:hypothetical protein
MKWWNLAHPRVTELEGKVERLEKELDTLKRVLSIPPYNIGRHVSNEGHNGPKELYERQQDISQYM